MCNMKKIISFASDFGLEDGSVGVVKGVINRIDEDLKVTLVSFLEWEDLPQVVRSYITINTARKFGAQVVGDTDLFQLTQQDELEARIEFRREQIDVEQANILYDSEASFGVLHRTRDYPNYGI